MKILILTGFYSAFHESLINGRWAPTGMPALYKLIEGLAQQKIETDILMLAKRPVNSLENRLKVKFDHLPNIKFYVLPFKGNNYKHLIKIINFVRHLYFLYNLIIHNHYQLFYCDRTNVVLGAILKILGKRVVLRLYGVANLCEDRAFKLGFIPAPEVLCFYSRFDYVICSRDGSPSELFRQKFIHANVPFETLFNGVDLLKSSRDNDIDLRRQYHLSTEIKIILTIGRFTPDKAIKELVTSLVKLAGISRNYFAIIIGDGPLLGEMQNVVNENRLESLIVFTGAIPHQQIPAYLKQADIFVSLNLLGNLSNAVLEAMWAGRCIVTLKRCPITGRDAQNDEPDLQEALELIDRKHIEAQLPETLNKLLNTKELIQKKQKKILKYTQHHLHSWYERINHEIRILTGLAHENCHIDL